MNKRIASRAARNRRARAELQIRLAQMVAQYRADTTIDVAFRHALDGRRLAAEYAIVDEALDDLRLALAQMESILLRWVDAQESWEALVVRINQLLALLEAEIGQGEMRLLVQAHEALIEMRAAAPEMSGPEELADRVNEVVELINGLRLLIDQFRPAQSLWRDLAEAGSPAATAVGPRFAELERLLMVSRLGDRSDRALIQMEMASLANDLRQTLPEVSALLGKLT